MAIRGSSQLRDGSHNIGLDPYSGRINELAIDPTSPFIMYATGATGGLWKTTDSGIRWAALSTGWPIQSATAVAIDPNDPNRVFVGTGDYKRLDHVPPFSVGVMRSLEEHRNYGHSLLSSRKTVMTEGFYGLTTHPERAGST